MRFELNSDGVSELLKSSEIQGLLTAKGNAIKERCGSGYVAETKIGTKRARSQVVAKSIKARKDNSKNNTLLKALK